MKKLIIFDLDGTLLDTIEDIRFTLNSVLEEYNLKTIDRENLIGKLGFGARRLVELSIPKDNPYLFEPIFDKYAKRLKNSTNERTVLYDGLDGVLKALKKDGYRLAVVSNKPDDAVKVVCEQKLGAYGFEFFMGNDAKLFKPKPDKSCVEYCLNRLGVKKEDAIYVGDSEVDVETFLNAEMDGIGVLWGFRSKETLIDAGCKNIAKTPSELYEIIKSFK
jgi:phosphoglycolate phosphatase